MKTFISLSLSFVIGTFLSHAQDWKFNQTGTIILKLAENPNMCIRTEVFNFYFSLMKLDECSKEYPVHEGDKSIDVGQVNDNDIQLRVTHVPMHGGYGTFLCLFSGNFDGNSPNAPVFTNNCNFSSPYQYWNLVKLENENFQLFHVKTAKCIRAKNRFTPATDLFTSECDANDSSQQWIIDNVNSYKIL